jgi:hypothetical protein
VPRTVLSTCNAARGLRLGAKLCEGYLFADCGCSMHYICARPREWRPHHGYRWGVERKRALLLRERAAGPKAAR